MMLFPHRLRLWLFAALAFAVGFTGLEFDRLPQGGEGKGAIMVVSVSLPQAQAQSQRRSLLSVLFGRDKAKRKSVRKRTRSSNRRRTKRRTNNARSASAATEVVEKSEDARTVLVVGDFYADDIYEGLQANFSDQPGITFINRSNGLSGFVRTDIVDWPATIGPMVEELKPDFVIFMAGSNDRQQIRTPEGRFDRMTPQWQAAYKLRLKAMSDALKEAKVPFTWVGLPSVRFDTMSRDFIAMNGWYKNAAEKVPLGKFTDIWDGFADADGAYTRSGPDVSGQIVLLRRKDGINMTDDGERRLAFYLDSDIRRILEGQIAERRGITEFSGLGGFGVDGRAPSYDPAKTGRTAVINLDDPSADGGEVLAGARISFKSNTRSAAVPVPGAARSSASPKREGRVDDHSWPPADLQVVTPEGAVARAGG